jgi:hypothetical protein
MLDFLHPLFLLTVAVPAHRDFVRRAAVWAARHLEMRQFIHFGGGLPLHEDHLHTALWQSSQDADVVYAESDPVVLNHLEARLHAVPRTWRIAAEVTEPEQMLADVAYETGLSLNDPLAVLYDAAALDPGHVLGDVLTRVTSQLAPGSIVAITSATADFSHGHIEELASPLETDGTPYPLRAHQAFADLVEGADLRVLSPGVTSLPRWRILPREVQQPDDAVSRYAALAQVQTPHPRNSTTRAASC